MNVPAQSQQGCARAVTAPHLPPRPSRSAYPRPCSLQTVATAPPAGASAGCAGGQDRPLPLRRGSATCSRRRCPGCPEGPRGTISAGRAARQRAERAASRHASRTGLASSRAAEPGLTLLPAGTHAGKTRSAAVSITPPRLRPSRVAARPGSPPIAGRRTVSAARAPPFNLNFLLKTQVNLSLHPIYF